MLPTDVLLHSSQSAVWTHTLWTLAFHGSVQQLSYNCCYIFIMFYCPTARQMSSTPLSVSSSLASWRHAYRHTILLFKLFLDELLRKNEQTRHLRSFINKSLNSLQWNELSCRSEAFGYQFLIFLIFFVNCGNLKLSNNFLAVEMFLIIEYLLSKMAFIADNFSAFICNYLHT